MKTASYFPQRKSDDSESCRRRRDAARAACSVNESEVAASPVDSADTTRRHDSTGTRDSSVLHVPGQSRETLCESEHMTSESEHVTGKSEQ